MLILEAEKLARARYNYKPDPKGADTWRSFANQAIAGQWWNGDCDDLASTVLDLLGRKGVPLHDRYRLLVTASDGKFVDHMVGAVRDERGVLYVIGDTDAEKPYLLTRMKHRPVFYQQMSQAREGIWKEGKPK